MPLERIVEQVLMVSDNDAAEVLFRHVAVAKQRRGTSAEASRAVRAELTELGLWRDGTVIADGRCGLSRQNRSRPRCWPGRARLAAGDDRPHCAGVITGLSVVESRAVCGAVTSTTKACPAAEWCGARRAPCARYTRWPGCCAPGTARCWSMRS